MRTTYVPFCRHTKTNGLLCRSAALTDSAFCYHHQKLRRTQRRTINAGPGLSPNVLYPLRNAKSIQQAIDMVLTGLATGQIHERKASAMISGLRVAMEIQRTTRME